MYQQIFGSLFERSLRQGARRLLEIIAHPQRAAARARVLLDIGVEPLGTSCTLQIRERGLRHLASPSPARTGRPIQIGVATIALIGVSQAKSATT